MRNIRIITVAFAILLSGCMQQEPVGVISKISSPIFKASLENETTRTFLDNDQKLLWTSDDQITIFTSTYNQQYVFKGENGSTSGDFEEVKTAGFHSGNTISTNYAVYPYLPGTKMSNEEVITLSLPDVQLYAENSFGLEANSMVAVTSSPNDYFLPFKNLCGYLVFKLYGEGSVVSMSIKGNNDEKISGAANIVAEYAKEPKTTMADNATTTIIIDCGEGGVKLADSADSATEFWFCIPPVSFTKGFTITATNSEGMSMVKTVSSSRTITRNVINTMPALEADFNVRLGNIEFEDANFKAYCVENFDEDGDGEINYEEAKLVQSISVSTENIYSLAGIEFFENLKQLHCSAGYHYENDTIVFDGKLKELDVSKNVKLTGLYCGHNQICNLDISKLVSLCSLNCEGNNLSSLDVSNNRDLDRLSCQENYLTSLDVSNNQQITFLCCKNNDIAALNVSGLSKLNSLECYPMKGKIRQNSSNELMYLYIAEGQIIPNVTVNRSDGAIPKETMIVVYGVLEAVDLGLSVKWANYNIGASSPEGFGDYYAWGESDYYYETGSAQSGTTQWKSGKQSYDWPSYSLCNGTGSTLIRYNDNSRMGLVDKKTILEHEDDVAYLSYGDKWRIPTISEWKELFDETKCDRKWVSQNDVKGLKITSKINGNSIFLPAAGYHWNTRYGDNGSRGIYWSSTISDSQMAFRYLFTSELDNSGPDWRWNGFSIRPVYGDLIRATGVSLDKSSMVLYVNEISDIAATVAPSDASENSVVWSTNNKSVAVVKSGKVRAIGEGQAVISATSADGRYVATCDVTVNALPESVDMGLSVKWATCNLGAIQPEQYGGYYQWAGLQNVKSASIDLSYSNCPYHTGSDYMTGWDKYIPSSQPSYWSGTGSPDNKTVLDQEDDVAHVKLGGKWRIPTDAEWTELMNTDNCTWTWNEQNGVKGYKVTSKKNGNSIFLPAAGNRNGTSLFNAGSYGNYWSSSLLPDNPGYVSYVDFSSAYVLCYRGTRYSGHSVRPVYGDNVKQIESPIKGNNWGWN